MALHRLQNAFCSCKSLYPRLGKPQLTSMKSVTILSGTFNALAYYDGIRRHLSYLQPADVELTWLWASSQKSIRCLLRPPVDLSFFLRLVPLNKTSILASSGAVSSSSLSEKSILGSTIAFNAGPYLVGILFHSPKSNQCLREIRELTPSPSTCACAVVNNVFLQNLFSNNQDKI